MVKQITEKELDEIIKNGKVLVDCFATWCGPCRMLSPILDNLSEDVKDYNFYKIDIDNAPEVASKYNIMSIPTILIFNDGKLVNTVIGLKSLDEIKELLK